MAVSAVAGGLVLVVDHHRPACAAAARVRMCSRMLLQYDMHYLFGRIPAHFSYGVPAFFSISVTQPPLGTDAPSPALPYRRSWWILPSKALCDDVAATWASATTTGWWSGRRGRDHRLRRPLLPQFCLKLGPARLDQLHNDLGHRRPAA